MSAVVTSVKNTRTHTHTYIHTNSCFLLERGGGSLISHHVPGEHTAGLETENMNTHTHTHTHTDCRGVPSTDVLMSQNVQGNVTSSGNALTLNLPVILNPARLLGSSRANSHPNSSPIGATGIRAQPTGSGT